MHMDMDMDMDMQMHMIKIKMPRTMTHRPVVAARPMATLRCTA